MKTLFLSSTFKDMQSERDLICNLVAPLLETYSVFGESVRIIDLRWGIDTTNLDSNDADHKILNECLNYARNSSLFIGFAGNRFGTSVKVSTLEKILEKETLKDIEIGADYVFGECPQILSLTMLEVLCRLGADIKKGNDLSSVMICMKKNKNEEPSSSKLEASLINQYRNGIIRILEGNIAYYDSRDLPEVYFWSDLAELNITKTIISYLDQRFEKKLQTYNDMDINEQDCYLISKFIEDTCLSTVSVSSWENYPNEILRKLIQSKSSSAILAAQHGMGSTELLCNVINTYKLMDGKSVIVTPDPLLRPLDEKRVLELILHQLRTLVNHVENINVNTESYYRAIENTLSSCYSELEYPVGFFLDLANVPNHQQIIKKLSSLIKNSDKAVFLATTAMPIGDLAIVCDLVFYIPALNISELCDITKEQIRNDGKEVSDEVSKLYLRKAERARFEKTPLYHSYLGLAHTQLLSSPDSAKLQNQEDITKWLATAIANFPDSTEAIMIEIVRQNDKLIGIGKLTEYAFYFIAASYDGIDRVVIAELVSEARKKHEFDNIPIESIEIYYYLMPLVRFFCIEKSNFAIYRLKHPWLKKKLISCLSNSNELQETYINYLLRFDLNEKFVIDNLTNLAYQAHKWEIIFDLMVKGVKKQIPLEPLTSHLHNLTKSDDGGGITEACLSHIPCSKSRSALSYLLWFVRQIKPVGSNNDETTRLYNIGNATLALFKQYHSKKIDIAYLDNAYKKTINHLTKYLALSYPKFVIGLEEFYRKARIDSEQTQSVADAFHSLGDAFSQLGKEKNAMFCYQKAKSIRERAKLTTTMKPFDYIDEGYAYWKSGKYKEASQAFSHAIKLFSESTILSIHETWLLGYCHSMIVRYEKRKEGNPKVLDLVALHHCKIAIQLITESIKESLNTNELRLRVEQKAWCEWVLVTHYSKSINIDDFSYYFELAFNDWCFLMSSATSKKDIELADSTIDDMFNYLGSLAMSLPNARDSNRLYALKSKYYDHWRDLEDQVFNGKSNIANSRYRSKSKHLPSNILAMLKEDQSTESSMD